MWTTAKNRALRMSAGRSPRSRSQALRAKPRKNASSPMGAMMAAATTTASASAEPWASGRVAGALDLEDARQQRLPRRARRGSPGSSPGTRRRRPAGRPAACPERGPASPCRTTTAPRHAPRTARCTRGTRSATTSRPSRKPYGWSGSTRSSGTEDGRDERADDQHQPEQQQRRRAAVQVRATVGARHDLVPGGGCEPDAERHDARERHDGATRRRLRLGRDQECRDAADAEQPRGQVQRRDRACPRG